MAVLLDIGVARGEEWGKVFIKSGTARAAVYYSLIIIHWGYSDVRGIEGEVIV